VVAIKINTFRIRAEAVQLEIVTCFYGHKFAKFTVGILRSGNRLQIKSKAFCFFLLF